MISSKFEYILITPFCIRSYEDWKVRLMARKRRNLPDPLSPYNLDSRYRYLRSLPYPSILGQTNQDFTWILIIDPNLPQAYRTLVEEMISARERSFIHVIENECLDQIEWLLPYLSDSGEREFLVTLSLDSDDALHENYMEDLQICLSQRFSRPNACPITAFGITDCKQWDLIQSQEAPYGWKAQWHRRRKQILSPGYGLAVKYPEYPLVCMGVGHSFASSAFQFSTDDPQRSSPYSIRRHAMELATANEDRLQARPLEEFLLPLDNIVGQPLMLNHSGTTQTRLNDKKENPQKVTGAHSFPGIPINWDVMWGDKI